MTTHKAQYFVSFRTGSGAIHSVPVAMEAEINSVADYQELTKTVAGYAVSQGFTRSLDDVTLVNVNLMNPSRDVEVIANEMLENAVVAMYERLESLEESRPDGFHSEYTELYLSIKAGEVENNG
jgi:hypothetical protein